MAELIPIGTILAVLLNQINKTALAAKDVVFEKESFKVLSKYLSDIEPLLKELQLRKLDDSPAARQALESLENDVRKASNLVEKYKNSARFYLLVKCRHIVKEVQDVTREIGKSLAALSFANIEIFSGISDKVNRLQNEMQRAEFEASQSRLEIVDRLNQGITNQTVDQEFANDLLEEIARAVGVPVEPAHISQELESFKREKEEAAIRKERAEVLFLEQVIELLSRADAARDYEEVKRQYFQRLEAIERYNPEEAYIHPFKPFICCITRAVMIDPVSLCTGTACERAALDAWFESGKKIDPQTGELLDDLSYRSNLHLRQSIQEWRELNYCVKIRSCKAKLMSEVDPSIEEALDQMQELIKENLINKDWISIGGLTEIILSTLGGSRAGYVNTKMMITLKDIIEGNARNKDMLVEKEGFDKVVPCLGLGQETSNAAIQLLYEVLQDKSGWNVEYCKKLSRQSNTIYFLVSLTKSTSPTLAKKAEEILIELCEKEEEIVVQAAKLDWFRPLISKILQGTDSSRASMVRVLVSMELNEQNLKHLGKEGIIPPLLEMSLGDVESKELSMSALVKLSCCHNNKTLIAAAGVVPLVLKLMFSSPTRTIILAKCSEILANLSLNGDGTKFFVDEDGTPLELAQIVSNLLALLKNLNSSDIVRRPVMHALSGICQSDPALVKLAVLSASGVSVVLPLLDDSDQEIREAAVNLLFHFSQHETQGIVEYLLKPRRLEAMVGFLENDNKGDVQMAAAGLLANLPKSETLLTEKLVEVGGLKAIINILRQGNIEAKENALGALFRFTDPTNLEKQCIVVEFGTYPLLVGFLTVDSVVAKARAAALLGDLSMRSQELADASKRGSCWEWILPLKVQSHDARHRASNGCTYDGSSNSPSCWCVARIRTPKCAAHGGLCTVNTTFCLLDGNALPGLVRLLHGNVHATAYEAIQTLSTLVREEAPNRGANVLHENDAIVPLIEVLSWGSESLKGEALGLLEKVFMSREMVDVYGSAARIPLVSLTGRSIYEVGHLQRKAARVLLLIERYSRSSSRSLVAVISG